MNHSKTLNLLLAFAVVLLIFQISYQKEDTKEQESNSETIEELVDYAQGEKISISGTPALYPTPTAVIGTEINGKPNWIQIAHIGHIGMKGLILSIGKAHYSNRGIKKHKTLSINMVSEAMIVKADYVGMKSGADTDKSKVFDYFNGSLKGAPMIKESPITMECKVVDVYDTEHHDNFVVEVENTYANKSILDEESNIDFSKVKPILFEMSKKKYIKTGKIVGDAWKDGANYKAD
ncbi:MAG: flavin reductase family protein [Marinifilaceae bacterium]|jgi:flavin reductase (DIM6/NTAB) family NADH-FMN oxidoreductase RutF|nr:flavin reductase family protein [Marinifilaceae bacterium]